MRPRVLPAVVLLALALALAGASTAHVPHRLPAIALASVLVWRVEVGAVVFAALYAVVVVARLALHGETLTRVGRDGIEIPRVGPAASTSRDDLAAWVDRAERLLAMAERRAGADGPTHPLLRHPEEGA